MMNECRENYTNKKWNLKWIELHLTDECILIEFSLDNTFLLSGEKRPHNLYPCFIYRRLNSTIIVLYAYLYIKREGETGRISWASGINATLL